MAPEKDPGALAATRLEQRRAAEHAAWRILASADDIDTAASQLMEALCKCGEWELGELWMVDGQAGMLRLTDLWNNSKRDLSEFIAISKTTTLARGIGLPGLVWSTGSPQWYEDFITTGSFPRKRYADAVGLHAAFGFPIRNRDEFFGVMTFYGPEFRKPDLDLLESMDLVGGQIGHFIGKIRAQQALAASEAQWQRIFAGAPIGIFHSLPDGRLLDVNPAFAGILGYASPAETLMAVNRTSIPEAIYVDPDRRPEFMAKLLKDRGRWASTEVLGRRPDGGVLTALLQARVLDEYRGEKDVFEGFVIDITERKKMETELKVALDEVRELTLRDHLTGLHNIRHLTERMGIEIAAARRAGNDVSVIMIDIDHFKAVNDTHGHSAGDAVLRNLSKILAGEVRPDDVLARYGGEEFVLLMRQTAVVNAVETAERLRARIEVNATMIEGLVLPLTISCGVASLAECPDGASNTILRLADQRLYLAKELGRNRVVGPENFGLMAGTMGGGGEGI